MVNCKSCANHIFDEKWGEYKCKVHKHRIRDVDKYLGCRSHKTKQEDKNIGNMAQRRTEV